ncbi:MAG TPA: hypothetical protein VGA72_09715 [Anaerolineales bacterium]
MKKIFLVTMITLLVMSTSFFAGSATAKEAKILEFGTMVGVPRPYTVAANAIRGIPGGGLPWVVGSAEGELKANGQLEIQVLGLVIDPNDQAAIDAGRAGTNPSPTFSAVVSCLSKNASGSPITVNVSTDPFPATTGLAISGGGNAKIEAIVSLPQPCIAPIIFVTNSTGTSWFAATGN